MFPSGDFSDGLGHWSQAYHVCIPTATIETLMWRFGVESLQNCLVEARGDDVA